MEKRARDQARFRGHHSIVDHLVTFRIIAEECHNDKMISFVVSLILEKFLTMCPKVTSRIGSEILKSLSS
jgi:hypothetical protein